MPVQPSLTLHGRVLEVLEAEPGPSLPLVTWDPGPSLSVLGSGAEILQEGKL